MIQPLEVKNSSKAQKTKEIILNAALDLFAEKGYANTSMRDIAKRAGVAVGGAYYYFRTKDEMILEVYARTQREAEKRNRDTCKNNKSFKFRMLDLLFYRLGLIEEHRELFVILTQNGVNPSNPLSPFAKETAGLRNAAVGLIEEAIEGSDLLLTNSLKPQLPFLLWFFQMAVILFWALDSSPEQTRTRKLVEISLGLMLPLFKLTLLPLAGMFNKMVIELHDLLRGMVKDDSQESDQTESANEVV